MTELQHKYYLRPREKSSTNILPKNILSWNKASEATITKPSTETQATRIKQVETKAVQAKKPENKEAEVQTMEIEKSIGTFNLENKLNNIKIPIPLG
jgi:hypothetical protein